MFDTTIIIVQLFRIISITDVDHILYQLGSLKVDISALSIKCNIRNIKKKIDIIHTFIKTRKNIKLLYICLYICHLLRLTKARKIRFKFEKLTKYSFTVKSTST